MEAREAYAVGVCPNCLEADIAFLRAALADKEMEIDVLRRYGNKDCTRQADEEIAKTRVENLRARFGR
jgi:hypothetical protein